MRVNLFPFWFSPTSISTKLQEYSFLRRIWIGLIGTLYNFIPIVDHLKGVRKQIQLIEKTLSEQQKALKLNSINRGDARYQKFAKNHVWDKHPLSGSIKTFQVLGTKTLTNKWNRFKNYVIRLDVL